MDSNILLIRFLTYTGKVLTLFVQRLTHGKLLRSYTVLIGKASGEKTDIIVSGSISRLGHGHIRFNKQTCRILQPLILKISMKGYAV